MPYEYIKAGCIDFSVCILHFSERKKSLDMMLLIIGLPLGAAQDPLIGQDINLSINVCVCGKWIFTVLGSMQIVHESDQVYGVSHSARISTIDAITKEDALEFLNAEEKAAATEQD